MQLLRAVLLVLAVPLSGAAAEPTAKDFARRSTNEAAKISPGGEYLAVSTYIEDQVALGVIDLKNRKLSGALRFMWGEHVADFWWVGPDRVVVAIATLDGPLDAPALTGELFAMNADGSQKTYLFGYRGGQHSGTHLPGAKAEAASAWMLDPLSEEPDHATIAVDYWHRKEGEFPVLYRLNVRSAALRRLGSVPAYPPITVATDRVGKPLFATGLDEDSHPVALARKQDGGWAPVNFERGKPRQVQALGVSADGQSAFLVSDEGSDRACLDEYRLASAELTRLSCHRTVDLEYAVFAHGDRRPVAAVYESGKTETLYLRPDHADAKLLRSIEGSFPGHRVRITSRTQDGRKLVVSVESDVSPGEYFLIDRNTGKAEIIFARRPWISPEQMRPVRPIHYTARDGAVVHGYLTLPRFPEGTKVPLVQMPHGGPHGVRDKWTWDAWGQFLASRGYAVLQVNYRGSGGYGFSHESAGYQNWGTLMQDDLTDAMRWARTQPMLDANRACIVGASYGGYAATMSVVREPELYRCAVTFAGVADLVSQHANSDIADSLMGRNFLTRVLGDAPEVLAQHSPITYLDKLKAPILIAHGTEDKRVPFAQAKRLRKALIKFHKPYEWMEFYGEGHGFWKEENHERFLTTAAAFLDRHLKAPPP